MERGHVLVVDDEKSILNSLTGILQDEGFQVSSAQTGEEGARIAASQQVDVILLDVWLKGMDGIQVLQHLRSSGISSPVIMISGHASIETAVAATKHGAYDFIEKPLSLEKVLLSVENALKQFRLEEENRTLKLQVQKQTELIGRSPAMENLREQIRKAAPTNGRVLIRGENGTGKELIARAIHRESLRRHRPFVEVNCAAIPEELIESELFGHERGAFTGALFQKKGKFELADGGTLFLDEIGDMSLRTQSKVLRALEEGRVERVGGQRPIPVDVRVIAATNKALEDEIREVRFREDLFYRLNVIPIQAPPLRTHPEDLPSLADSFLESFSRENGKRRKRLTQEALDALSGYHWPGNVRELRNVIERLVIMTPSQEIRWEDLPHPIRPQGEPRKRLEQVRPLREVREEFEREYILMALDGNDWNVSKTSDELQMGRNNLYVKMRSYNLDPSLLRRDRRSVRLEEEGG